LAHGGDLATGYVTEEAENFNIGLRAVATAPHPGTLLPRSPAIAINQPGVFISAAKRADDDSGDLVLRLYEAYGGRGEIAVGLGPLFRDQQLAARRVDLLERDIEGEETESLPGGLLSIELDPFELATIRVSPQVQAVGRAE
jgi:alpha-mannosidase